MSRLAGSAPAREDARPLATAVDSAFQFFGVLAPDGTVRDANATALAFERVTLEEVLGRPFWDTPWWSDDATREWLRGAVADAARGTLVRAEVEHASPDGRRIVVDFSLKPLRDDAGRVRALLAEGRDISERKRLEEALRGSEQRAAFLARASEVLSESLDREITFQRLAALIVPAVATFCIIDIVDEAGAVRRLQVVHERPEMRDVARRLTEYPRDQQHSYLTSEAIAHGRASFAARVEDAFLASIAVDEEHLTILRALAPASYIVAPLVARGRTLGAVAFCRDAAAPPYGEADLAMATDFANRAALALDNARLYEQSVRATRARDDMLGVVSHDLRNPISAIAMCASSLLEGRHADPARPAYLLRLIRDSAELSRRLIQDLLDVTALEAGRLGLECRPVDPLLIVAQAAELSSTMADEQGVALALDLPDHLPHVDADPERLLQALGNLLVNALKFTPKGGRVTLRGASDGARVTLAVSDTGPGIPTEDVPFVFDRFWHARRTAKVRGTGLGLAIVKGIVEAHGGRVRVEPEPGGGSRFSIELRVARSGV